MRTTACSERHQTDLQVEPDLFSSRLCHLRCGDLGIGKHRRCDDPVIQFVATLGNSLSRAAIPAFVTAWANMGWPAMSPTA